MDNFTKGPSGSVLAESCFLGAKKAGKGGTSRPLLRGDAPGSRFQREARPNICTGVDIELKLKAVEAGLCPGQPALCGGFR